MIKIAVVDDDEEYRIAERKFIEEYARETGGSFDIVCFPSGMDFISNYGQGFDIVFLDIEMPHLDGMETAKKLRQIDVRISIVFLTKMSKYAVEGYSVNAVDFMVKPLKRYVFIDKLKRAIAQVRTRHAGIVMIRCEGEYLSVPASQINYVLKEKNSLVYSTDSGEMREYGTMEDAKQKLEDNGFLMCNSGCLVNVNRITKVTQTEVIVGTEKLPLSRRRNKEFKEQMLRVLRGFSD